MFFFIILPHLGRAISVVIMIETIFLLSVFAEIYVTTSGGPGLASTNLAFLIYLRAARVRRRRRLGRRRDRGHPRQHRGRLPRALHRQEHRRLRARPCTRDLREKTILTVVGWLVAGLIFFPIFWMVLTSFKTEVEAVATPPQLFFQPTLENYRDVPASAPTTSTSRSTASSSRSAPRCSRLLIAVPAAYAMAFFPARRTKDLLLWMLSTKMMPAVGVLIPIYLLFRDIGALDSRWGLTLVYTLMNLPIVVWMLYTFFKEVPKEILEAGPHGRRQAQAGSLDPAPAAVAAGHRLHRAAVDHPVLERGVLEPEPDHLPGGAPDHLHRLVLGPEGLFWAKLSAASTMAIAPILVFGWMSQRQLVRGLTFGAVK